MANPDFKNIKFAYVRVVNGYPSIDKSMTDRIFQTTKPDGYYHCFIFPKEHFSGVDHGDLRNLVGIEKSSVWDETIRSTFLGYNSESNEFTLNLTAYYGLKVDGLKTTGNLKYSGQASFQTMVLTTTQQSNSIVTLKQTNGTNAYLNIKPINVDNTGSVTKVYPPLSIEVEKKSIKNSVLLVKDDMLWAKSTEDGTPIMVNNCVKAITTKDGTSIAISSDNKKYGYQKKGFIATVLVDTKTSRFGKELIYATRSVIPLLSCSPTVQIKSDASGSSIEYTNTDLLSDILASGESLTFQLTPKDKYVWGYQTKSTYNTDYPNVIVYNKNPLFSSNDAIAGGGEFELSEFINKDVKGYEYSLMSCDLKKPFLFNSIDRVYGVGSTSYIDATTMFANLPDGYIALMLCVLRSTQPNISIVRWKKGDPIKVKIATSTSDPSYVSVNGTSKFGGGLYTEVYDPFGTDTLLAFETAELNDIVNSTGFTDLTSDNKLMNSRTYSLITIVRL